MELEWHRFFGTKHTDEKPFDVINWGPQLLQPLRVIGAPMIVMVGRVQYRCGAV